jgi:hypothetical protein
MALVLSVRPGEDFFVGKEHVTRTKLISDMEFELTVESSGRVYTITGQQATPLREIEDVYISAGDRPQFGIARVVLDAPRSIPIMRGEVVRNNDTAHAHLRETVGKWG